MSVDTYLKGKNLSPYSVMRHEDVKVLLAPSLIRWATSVRLDVKQFLLWKSFDIEAEHKHGPSCAH